MMMATAPSCDCGHAPHLLVCATVLGSDERPASTRFAVGDEPTRSPSGQLVLHTRSAAFAAADLMEACDQMGDDEGYELAHETFHGYCRRLAQLTGADPAAVVDEVLVAAGALRAHA